MAINPRTHKDYTVGWVCALSKERTAAVAMLDHRHDNLPKLLSNDNNSYTLGSIGKHNIVIACLPPGVIGTVSSATLASQMVNAFPSIKFGLMVGIGGGIPTKVRLGDIVVSTPTPKYPGVVQWDFGKQENEDNITRTGSLNKPPTLLLTAVGDLKSEHEIRGSNIPDYLKEMASRYPRLTSKYLRSESLDDILFKADYGHRNDNDGHAMFDDVDAHGDEEEEYDTADEKEDGCHYCDKTQVVKRRSREMKVHYGLIASGNSFIKDAVFRDRLCKDLGGKVLCVEMEAAGLMDNFPCVVIRGICDYADSHKNKTWQEHAAALAAAYAKELLGYIQPSDVDKEQTVQDILREMSSDVSSIKRDVTYTRSRLDEEEDIKVLDWLMPTDYSSQHSDYLKRRQAGTGQWLLDSDEYQNWISEPNKTLFCPGIPGAGKTIMTSIVIDDLEKRFCSDTTISTAYVYCNYQFRSEQTLENLLSSLLRQIAQSHPSLPHSLKELYDRHRGTRPMLDEILRALELVITLDSRVFVVVDALDECQTSDNCRTKFLSAIFNLQTEIGVKTGINIFATSRLVPDITELFRGSLSIDIYATDNDIQKYLEGHMPELSNSVANRSDLQNEITTSITEAAQGMFLLARLYFASLIGESTPNKIRQTLRRLVEGSKDYEAAYNEAYESAMKRIRSQPRHQAELAEQTLSWITCAEKRLTRLELQHALAIQPGEPDFDEENLPVIDEVVSFCAGLVTIDKESGFVQLVHYTTQEYFERAETQSKWFPNAQLFILTACTTYLSYRSFAKGYCKTRKEYNERKRVHPFYRYAACNWGHHGRKLSSCQTACRTIVSFLCKPAHVKASSQPPMDRYSVYMLDLDIPNWALAPEMSGLHLVAYFGLDQVAMSLLKDYPDDCINPNLQDKIGQTPLLLAAENGHEAIVKLLLTTKQADPNIGENDGWTPLFVAAESGHEAIVKLLLATKQTPLSIAAENGYEAIVKLLLATKQVDPNAKDNKGRTPLSLAARNWRGAVLELLLPVTEQIELDMNDIQYGSPPFRWSDE
ncbi:hypothetical protein F4802DRAFT_608355 [Xylaria palmicola]|nr:hypothetical protein F4802DRAFT_608355 [Xylaria palmicola]